MYLHHQSIHDAMITSTEISYLISHKHSTRDFGTQQPCDAILKAEDHRQVRF